MNVCRFGAGNYQLAGLGLLFCIFLVWQIPNVIALRYLLLLGLCILFLPAGVRGIHVGMTRQSGRVSSTPVFLVYALFLAWLLFVAIGIAAESIPSLMYIKGQWLPPTLFLIIGYGAALACSDGRIPGRSPVRTVFWALMAHAVLQLVVAAWTIYHEGSLPGNFGGISDHKANVTYTNTLALALLLTDGVGGSAGARFLGLGRRLQAITYVVLLISTYASSTRNGAVVFFLLSVIGVVAIALPDRHKAPRRWWGIAAMCVVASTMAAWLMLKSDARWERFMATVPVAWDIDANHAWVNVHKYPVPLAADGKPVDINAYERIAYARVALRFLAQYPLGTAVSGDAFKRLVSMNYSYVYSGHPHNSYLDLGISIGLPGLALWLACLASMIWFGWRSFRRWKNPTGMALVMVALGFALRSLLDSIVRDHIIQEFMLTCGLLIGCIEAYRAEKELIASR